MAYLHNPHPGETLKEEFLEEIGMSQNRLAHAIGVPRNRIHAIVNGTRDVTADTDLRLCKFFGLSEGYFLRLQNAYDMLEAKRRIARRGGKDQALQARRGSIAGNRTLWARHSGAPTHDCVRENATCERYLRTAPVLCMGLFFKKRIPLPPARVERGKEPGQAPSAGVVAAVNRSDVDAPPTPHLGFRVRAKEDARPGMTALERDFDSPDRTAGRLTAIPRESARRSGTARSRAAGSAAA
jgi:antitoxin HigA-1